MEKAFTIIKKILEEDDIEKFINESSKIKNWKEIYLEEEKEYLVHYAVSNIF